MVFLKDIKNNNLKKDKKDEKQNKSVHCYPHAFLKKRMGYCYRLRPSVRLSGRPSVMISPPKPLDEIQPNLVCELLT